MEKNKQQTAVEQLMTDADIRKNEVDAATKKFKESYKKHEITEFEISAFAVGYNKAKETLYTEEQVREAIRLAHSSHRRYLDFLEDDIIQSLKQK